MSRLAVFCRRRDMRLMVVLVVLVTIFSGVDRGELLRHVRGLNVPILAGMFAVNIAILFLSAWRWSLIGSIVGFRAPLITFVRTTWLTWAVAECGPSLVVGEWARFRLMRTFAGPIQLAVSQFVDRLSAYIGLVLLALAAAIGSFSFELNPPGTHPVLLLASAILLGLTLITALLRRFSASLDRDSASLDALRNALGAPAHYGLSLAANALFAGNFALAAVALGFGVRSWDVLWLAPLVLMGAGSLPSLVSDWGKREAAAVVGLTQMGFGPEQGIAISLVYGSVNLLGALPGFLFFWCGPEAGLPRKDEHPLVR